MPGLPPPRQSAPRPGFRLLPLLRCSHPEPTFAVTAVAAALAASAGRGAYGIVVTALAVLTGQLSVGWSNDAIDAARDVRSGRRDKPIAAGEIEARTVAAAAFVALLCCVPLSLLSGWRAGAFHVVAVLAAWSYNLRLKSTPASVLPYALAFGLLPAFVVGGLPGAPLPPWWALAAGGLLGAGAHFANVLPDLDDDLRTGIRGLPHRLGPTLSRRLAALLLLLASAVLVLGPGRGGSPGTPASLPFTVLALAGVAALVVAGVVAERTVGSRIAFRMTLVVAAVDVALLVARGRALS